MEMNHTSFTCFRQTFQNIPTGANNFLVTSEGTEAHIDFVELLCALFYMRFLEKIQVSALHVLIFYINSQVF